MRRNLVLVLLALVVLAALVVLEVTETEGPSDLVRRDGDAAGASPTRTHVAPALAGRPGATESGSTARGDALAPPAATEGPRMLGAEGRVLAAESGDPIAGATVEIVVYRDADSKAPDSEAGARTSTDADGRYVLSLRRPQAHAVQLRARAPGRVAERLPPYRVLEVSGLVVHRHEFRLPRAGRVEGRVVRADGGPLGGIRVQPVAWGKAPVQDPPSSTTTSADGSFVVDQVPFGARLVLAASAPDVQGSSAPFRLTDAAPSRQGVRVHLFRSATIRGRLLRDDGSPWTGGKLWLGDQGVQQVCWSRLSWRARPDGTFEIPAVDAGTYALHFADDRLGDERVLRTGLHVAGDDVDLGDFVVAAGRPVSGRLVFEDVDLEEPPWPDLYLVRGAFYYAAEMEEDGSFRFPAVADGTWRFVVDSNLYRTKRDVYVEAGTEDLVVDVVGPSAALRIRLVEESGAAARAAHVLTLLPHGVSDTPIFRTAQGAAPEVVFERLPPGRYDLRLEVEGFRFWRRDGVTLARNETVRLDARLEPAPRLRRRVVTVAGRPVAWADVVLSYRNDYPLGPLNPRLHDVFLDDTLTDATGHFEIGIPRPDLTITVKADGHASLRQPVAELGEGEIVLPRGWDLVGRLVGPDDVALESVHLTLDSDAGHTNTARATFTDLDGAFCFFHVPSGSFLLRVHGHSGQVVQTVPLTAEDGPTDVGSIRVIER